MSVAEKDSGSATSRLAPYCLGVTATIKDAIELLDSNQRGVGLVLDSGGRLVDIVTDGDLRRAFYHRASLNELLVKILRVVKPESHRAPVCASADASREAVSALLEKHAIRHLPLIDHT